MRIDPAPTIAIGIVKAKSIRFSLEGDYMIQGKEEPGFEHAEANLIQGRIKLRK